MNIIAKHNNIKVFAIGDIHGQFDVLRIRIETLDLKNAVLFLVGDLRVGFGYNDTLRFEKEREMLFEYNKFIKARNLFIYAIRGNHDNPIVFNGKHNYSNIIFMQDYDIVDVNGFLYLGIGGAISVDRKANHYFFSLDRIEGVDWWKTEKIVYDEEKINKIAGIDVVIAHTSPHFVFPKIFNDFVNKCIECDPELKDELIEERETMANIYEKLNELSVIKKFIYGHFHRSNSTVYNNTEFELLNIGEVYEIIFDNEKGT